MSKIWLFRGVAVAVLGMLVGAWALGLAGLGEAESPRKDRAPASEERPPDLEIVRSVVLERAKPRRTQEAEPTEEAVVDPTTAAADPTSDAADPTTSPTSEPTPSDPTDDPTAPTPTPSDPPTSPPSSPPTTPDDECDDLGDVVDCVLDPITGRP